MKPNIIIVFADQLRAQSLGYMGDPNVKSPMIDRFAQESVNFTHAISSCPVCSPARASILTGQYPLTHGVFINDVPLKTKAISFAQAFASAGYDTGYIGKWHIDGSGNRSAFIPKERRLGFDYWKVLECTHDYNHSYYYDDSPKEQLWSEYDAIAQTKDTCNYLKSHKNIQSNQPDRPFLLFLSWGPPHDPYHTAPEQFQKLYTPSKIKLPPNVPRRHKKRAKKELAGYYAHISALDYCMNELLTTLHETGLEANTIVVFTSDHGDMLGSLGMQKKQMPWDESIRIPLLIRFPNELNLKSAVHLTLQPTIDIPINLMDLMPTMLGLAQIPIPPSVEGEDFTSIIQRTRSISDNAVLIACFWPFSNWRKEKGGREYRGIRTRRYTYVRSLEGPWLLYDDDLDPYQQHNLCNKTKFQAIQQDLEKQLQNKLNQYHDKFLPGEELLQNWDYRVDKSGAVAYKD
jgi:arylsulfatase A-like enzyme